MDQDQEHLRLLSIFHYVVGGIGAAFSCFPIFYVALGLLMATRPDMFGPHKDQPPAVVGWMIVVFGGAFIRAGWILSGLILYAGRCLSRRVHHTYCFVIACVECLFAPFGTVL